MHSENQLSVVRPGGLADDNLAGPIGDSLKHCATASQRFQPQHQTCTQVAVGDPPESSERSSIVSGVLPVSPSGAAASSLFGPDRVFGLEGRSRSVSRSYHVAVESPCLEAS